MTGTAALAMIALPSASNAEQKWQPYSDIGGKIGDDRAIGQVEFFVPLWQDSDTLFFGNVRGRFDDESSEEGNFGLGLRERINPEWILGVYGFYDVKNSEYDNTFDQFSAGIEFMSEDWDFRLNAYLAEDNLEFVPGLARVEVNGNSIQMFNGAEGALSGFDGEVGYRVWKDAMMEARLFIGGFYFDHDDLEEVAGPRARAELRMFDLDFLGAQSRLTFEGEVQHDQVRDTTAFAGLSLRVPLSAATGGGASQLQGLDRRMVDSIRRDIDIVTTVSGDLDIFQEDIFLVSPTGKGGSFDTIIYVDNTGGGVGSYIDPEDFDQATFTAGSSSTIFVALDATGVIDAPTKGVALEDGQALLGGGTTIKAQGATTGQFAYFTFDGSRPQIDGTDGSYSIVTLGNGNWVENIDFAGKFANAIYGENAQGFEIADIAVDGSAGGANGIYLYNQVSGDFGGAIRGSSFEYLSGDGINITTIIADGGESTLSFTLQDIFMYGVGVDGLHFYTSAFADSDIAVDLTVDGLDVIFAGDEGVSIFNYASDDGSTIDATGSITLNDVYVYGSGDYGVFFGNYATDLSSIDADFHFNGVTAVANSSVGIGGGADARYGAAVTVSVGGTGITADDNGSDGVYIYAEAYSGDTAGPAFIPSTVNITLDLDAVTARDNFNAGISLWAEVGAGASVTQSGGIGKVTSIDNGDDGLVIAASAYDTTSYGGTLYTSSVSQYITSTGGEISDNGDTGISVVADARDGASIDQGFSATGDLTVEYNVGHGIFMEADASAYASKGGYYFFSNIEQGVSLAGGSVSYNGDNGVYVNGSSADASSVEQDLDLTDVAVNGNGSDGVFVNGASADYLYAGGLFRSRLAQDVVITGGSISKNSDDGVDIQGDVSDVGLLYQSVTVTDADISSNNGGGVYMSIAADDAGKFGGGLYGSSGFQSLTLTGTTVSGNDYGIYARADAEDGARSVQYITLQDAALIDGNDGHGIEVRGYADGYFASGGSYLRSYLAQGINVLGGSDITNNDGEGINVAQFVSDEAEGDLQIYLEGAGKDLATISGNSGSGIVIQSTVTGGGYNDIDLGFTDSSVSGNGGYGVGIFSQTNDSGLVSYFTTDTDIVVETENAAFDNNGANGSYDGFRVEMDVVSSAATGSTGSLFMDIEDSTFDGNTGSGLYLDVTASGANATVSSTVVIDPSSASNNDGDGLFFNFETSDKASGSVYLALLDSAFDGNGDDGVDFDVDSYSGSGITATLVASYSTFNGNEEDGLNADFYSGGVNGGTASTMTAAVTLAGVTANDSDDADGVDIAFRAWYGGQTKGTATLTDVTANNNDSDGIRLEVESDGDTGGTYSYATGSFTLTDAAASGNDTGLDFEVSAYFGAIALGSLSVSDGTFTGNGINAYIDVYAYQDGDAAADVTIADSSFTKAGGDGISISVESYNGDSYSDLDLYIRDTDISSNGGNGIYARQRIYGEYDSDMSIYLHSTTINGNGGDGIGVNAQALDGVTYMYTALTARGVTISGNGDDGVDFVALGTAAGANIEADVYIGNYGIKGTTITTNGGDGVAVQSWVTGVGSDGYLDVYVFDAAVTSNTGGGIVVDAASYNGAIMTSEVYVYGATVSKNGLSGISVDAYAAGTDAYIESDVRIFSSTVTYNGGDGINVALTAYDGAEDVNTSDVFIDNVNASFNDGAGISVSVSSDDAEITGASVTISDTYASYNGGGGIRVSAFAENGGYLAITNVALSYITAQKNDGAGIYLGNRADGAGSESRFDTTGGNDNELLYVNANYNDVGIIIRNAATNGGLGTLARQDIDGTYLSAVGNGITLGPPAVFPDGMRFINLGTNGGTDADQYIDVNFIDVSDNFIGVRIQDSTQGNQTGTINNATYYNTPFLYFYVGGGGGFVITP